jgi:hypothetical protein
MGNRRPRSGRTHKPRPKISNLIFFEPKICVCALQMNNMHMYVSWITNRLRVCHKMIFFNDLWGGKGELKSASREGIKK